MHSSIGPIDRLVLLGGGDLLARLVSWALSEGLPVAVVTSPRHADETVGGGDKSLRSFLEDNGVRHIVADSINDQGVAGFLGDATQAFCLSLGAAWIFKKDTIQDLFDDQLFNLHGARLPQNRGAGGFSWQIMMGSRFGYCLLHLVDGGIDTGSIVRFEEFLYPAACRVPADFQEEYNARNHQFLTRFLSEIRRETVDLDRLSQPEYLSTYWPRLNTEINGWIDWRDTLTDLERFVCAFDDPYEGAKTFLADKQVFLKGAFQDGAEGGFHSFQNGMVFRVNPNWICVCAGGGTLVVERVEDADGNSILDRIKPGDRFHTPVDKLEQRTSRAVFTPRGPK